MDQEKFEEQHRVRAAKVLSSVDNLMKTEDEAGVRRGGVAMLLACIVDAMCDTRNKKQRKGGEKHMQSRAGKSYVGNSPKRNGKRATNVSLSKTCETHC